MPSEADVLQAFASDLRRFKIECGDPSLVKIARLSERWEPHLSKSTIGDVMNGKRMPGLDSTMSLIRSLISYGDSCEQVSRDDARLKEWRTRWNDTKNQLDKVRRATRAPQPPSPPSGAPQPPPASTGATSSAATAEDPQAPKRPEATFRPTISELPVQRVQRLRSMLTKAFGVKDSQGRKWADAKYGCFAFFDYDGDPLYVGSASERLRTRIQRHLISQRTDAVAWGILDVQEVAEMELWPLWDLTETQRKLAMEPLSRAEREVYLQAVEGSRFGALLNERVPARTEHTILPSSRRFTLVDEQTRSDQGHADVRIARRAATVARLSSLFMDRGIVTEGARRAMILQSARLTHLAATQLAYVEGRPAPTAELINVPDLIGRNVSDL